MDTTMFDKVPPTLQISLYRSQFIRIHRLRCTQIDLTSSITYADGQSITDLGPIQDYFMTNDTALVPVDPVPQPVASQTVELEVVFQTMDDGTNHAMLNGYVYNSPIVPAIMSVLTLGDNATTQEAYGPYSIMLNHLDVVDIVVKNADTGSHPLCGGIFSDRVAVSLLTSMLQPLTRSQVPDRQSRRTVQLDGSYIEPSAHRGPS